MTPRLFAIYAALLLSLVTGLSIWGFIGLNRHLIAAIDRYAAAAPSAGKLDALATRAADALPAKGKINQLADSASGTLRTAQQQIQRTSDNLNRPCKGPGGASACGTLAQVNKTVVKAGDAIVTTQRAELKALPHITAAMDAFRDAAFSIDDAGTSASDAFESFNELLESKDLTAAIAHANAMTASGDGILADARQVSDKVTKDFLAPVPWWKKPIRKAGALIDITAALARHAP